MIPLHGILNTEKVQSGGAAHDEKGDEDENEKRKLTVAKKKQKEKGRKEGKN